GWSQSGLQFNVSHSHGLALFAFAVAQQVGVDVEMVRADFAGEKIAERFFSSQEVRALRSLPAAVQDDGFFLCWTRKEAYIKARGEGLQIPLKSFHVSLTPTKPARLQADDSSRCRLRYTKETLPTTHLACSREKTHRKNKADRVHGISVRQRPACAFRIAIAVVAGPAGRARLARGAVP